MTRSSPRPALHRPDPPPGPGRITAVLGPTNTGKTHLALERMLGHASGMMGFPLRLLARETYDRVLRLKGANQVALVTGEEKILPPHPRYFLCTVESMPVDRPVEFLAVDEIQLCADPERGHIFTDRLLHARGIAETMFLGADTMREMIRALVPGAEVISRPRFSTLSYAGTKKLTRLPPRSAVVGFSADDVYATAELLRRNRGGTAVVLGALSPRTRNAQVAMFENGEVDYLVATDAIGMGLNLNLEQVYFARLSKFDGRSSRPLTNAEIAQIAGRAGRHMTDGSFGTTQQVGGLPPETVEAVEAHRFDPVTRLSWRSGKLDFKSPERLLRSLETPPPAPQLAKGRDADDYLALRHLARDPTIAELAATPADVALLWEVCQIPDFRKVLSDQHVRLLAQVYRRLVRGAGHLSGAWVGNQLARFDRIDGDLDSLVTRLAHIRTWTYITHRGDWLADSAHWQAQARAIEDRLSDALHETLTQRFVDRRAATLVRRLADGGDLIGAVRRGGEVLVEGEYVGKLRGFRFTLDAEVRGADARPLHAAARKALAGEIPARVKRLEAADDGAFALDDAGGLSWCGEPVARLEAGSTPLRPQVAVDDSDFLDAVLRERLRQRLDAWLSRHLRNKLRPLYTLAEAELAARPRGVAFQVVEALGVLPRAEVTQAVRALSRAERKALHDLGVRLGRETVWLPAARKPEARRLKALLLSVHRGAPGAVPTPAEGRVFWPDAATDEALCRALGYRRIEGPRRGGTGRATAVALDVDALERLAGALHKLRPAGPFTPTANLAALVGDDREALNLALLALGYVRSGDGPAPAFRPRGPSKRRRRRSGPATETGAPAPPSAAKRGGRVKGPAPPAKDRGPAQRPRPRPDPDPDHPFAKLRDLTFPK